MLKLFGQHPIKFSFAVCLGLGAVVGILLWQEQFDMDDAIRLKDEALGFLQGTHPALLLAAIAILPLFGFPVSPLLLLCGLAQDGEQNKMLGMLIGVVGIALNDALGYGIASWLREPVQRFLVRKKIIVPNIPDKDAAKVVILFRVTPGFPLPFQNFLLGLACVPFFTYMWASLLPQTVIVAGFVLTGGAIFEGQWGMMLLGISLIIVFAIAGRIIMQQRKKKAALNNVTA